MAAARPSRHRSPVAPDAYGLFTRPDAFAADWTDSALYAARAGARLRRAHRGVFTSAPPVGATPSPDELRAELALRAVASVRVAERAVVSHAAAAVLHGLPTVCALDRPCLTVQSGSAVRTYADAHLHRARLRDADCVVLAGVRVTGAARTVLDVAREFGVDAGVCAADAALHTGLMDSAELMHVLELCRRWPGGAAARATAALADGSAESPLESLSRLRLRSHGLPLPRAQVSLGDGNGRFVRRVDFYWPEFGVAGEADGLTKYPDRAALLAEKRQQEALEALGLVIVRWGWPDVFAFTPVASRLTSAFARGTPTGRGQRWSVLSPLHP